MTAIQICPSMAEFAALKGRVGSLEQRTILSAPGLGGNSVLVTGGTVRNVSSLALTAGLWIIEGWLTVSPVAPPSRIRLTILENPTEWTNSDRTEFTSSYGGIVHNSRFVDLTGAQTYYLNFQGGGDCRIAYGGMQAVKVR